MSEMAIYKTRAGRYIVARYDRRQAQYVGHAVPAPIQGYVYTYGRTVDALVPLGVPTYASLAGARRALRQRYGRDGE